MPVKDTLDRGTDAARLQHLEQRTYHIDGEVTAIKTQLGTQNDALQRIENNLMNKQPIWNISNVMSLLVVAGGLILGMVTYVHTLIEPIDDRMDMYDAFRYEMHYEVGVMQHSFEQNDKRWDHFDTLHHKQDDAIGKLREKAAQTDVYFDKISRALDDVDKYGSRRWGMEPIK
jgi:hypothetical protein